ncbi:DNA binding protein, partial [Trifolium pratense]
ETTNENPPNLSAAGATQSETQQESSLRTRGKTDPTWEHVTIRIVNGKQVLTCIYCKKSWKGGGIHRMKEHLAKSKGNVLICDKVPADVCHQMDQLLHGNKKKKKDDELTDKELNDAYDDQSHTQTNEQVAPVSNPGKRKACDDAYFAPRTTPGSQPTIKSAFASKQVIHKAKMALARWFFDSNIPFNATKSPYFQEAADAIASIGPGFKVPTYHDIRVNLLGDCKRECSLLVEGYRSKWAKDGCTIMADGWSDQKQRTLINFLVYSPQGIVFVKSVDASGVVKDAQMLCNLFSEVIDWVGHKNVVHIVTDNAANYVAAGRKIHEKYDSIFWTPCAAHCLNLLLKDISSMPHVAGLEHQRLNDLVYVAYNLRLQNRGKPKKIYYDPIDYESIDDIDFWVNEDAPPELDINEIENLLYHDDAIPIVENLSRNNQGDDEFDTSEFQVEADNVVDGNGGSNGEDVGTSNVNFDYGETNLEDYNDY